MNHLRRDRTWAVLEKCAASDVRSKITFSAIDSWTKGGGTLRAGGWCSRVGGGSNRWGRSHRWTVRPGVRTKESEWVEREDHENHHLTNCTTLPASAPEIEDSKGWVQESFGDNSKGKKVRPSDNNRALWWKDLWEKEREREGDLSVFLFYILITQHVWL